MTEDIRAIRSGAVLLIQPLTAAAEDWIEANVEQPCWASDSASFVCDHRYGPDILVGAYQAGLSVSLDGRMADADL